jgi:mRNA interferase MazF
MVNGKDPERGPERGEIWWGDLPSPRGSEPGYRRPVLVIQADEFNLSRIQTIIVAAISSNLSLGQLPGNVFIARRASGLRRDSIVNVSQLFSLDRRFLDAPVGKLPARVQAQVDEGLRLVLAL